MTEAKKTPRKIISAPAEAAKKTSRKTPFQNAVAKMEFVEKFPANPGLYLYFTNAKSKLAVVLVTGEEKSRRINGLSDGAVLTGFSDEAQFKGFFSKESISIPCESFIKKEKK